MLPPGRIRRKPAPEPPILQFASDKPLIILLLLLLNIITTTAIILLITENNNNNGNNTATMRISGQQTGVS